MKAAAVLVLTLATAAPAAAPAHAADLRPHDHSHGVSRVKPVTRAKISQPGLPADAPAALYRHEPALPKAAGWPGSNSAFPRTSGTGRLAKGGLFWTDYLYDDHGTTTSSTGDMSVTAGSPSFGTYTYPSGPAHNNGADIFRSAVQLTKSATYWRVDWQTLAKRTVPIAEWTFDRDGKTGTGGSQWPAGAGVSSAGIDTALVVSAKSAHLIDVASGKDLATLTTTVDMKAQSFVVKVPRSVLKPTGAWRIRLAAGLADAAGVAFVAAPDADPGQPAVYNVTFRTPKQETPTNNFWNDMAQTNALRTGNVSSFSTVLRWSDLAAKRTTRQAARNGWSDRWYVSAVKLGSGVKVDSASIADGRPNYLGRVQPYAVYVPKSYSGKHATRFTFLLHSLTQNHNQYAATTPNFSKQACEARHSICATTLGRGPDGNYFDYAELDFWQVWHAVASSYRLDPDRTVLSGYSMGGIGTNQLTMAHPDLFASGVTLAGAVGGVPSLPNLRWVPIYLAGGAEDELVPYTVQKAEADGLKALGYRYRWVEYPAIDHVAYELADSFGDAAKYMGLGKRVSNPGQFRFVWTPRNSQTDFGSRGASGGGLSWTQLPKYGVGTTGDYWLRHLVARSSKKQSSLSAFSGERPVRAIKLHKATTAGPGSPEPAKVESLTWTLGKHNAKRALLRLTLHNVKSLHVLLSDAGFRHGRHGKLTVTTDGPTAIGLGSHVVHVGKGHHVVSFTA